ncbi:DUF1911 domain-containing protein [Massilia sp. LMS1-1-1.1]
MITATFNVRRRQKFLYEDLYHKTRENLLALIEVRLANKKIVESTLKNSVAHQFLYLEAFLIWMLDYTAGEPIDALAPRIPSIVDRFEGWNEIDQFCQQEAALEFPDYGPYEYNGAPDFSTLANYENTLQLLSIAILLRDQRSVMRIIRIFRSHRGQDGLFEQLIGAYVDDEMPLDTCVLGQPYETLLQTVYESDEGAAQTLIKKYLKQWYPAMKDHPRWYNGHLRISDEGYAPYYGYWAFEAGATVFLLDLDDSGIDHFAYPTDIVAYGRALREENRYTSIDMNAADDVGHVESKQPCHDTDFRE